MPRVRPEDRKLSKHYLDGLWLVIKRGYKKNVIFPTECTYFQGASRIFAGNLSPFDTWNKVPSRSAGTSSPAGVEGHRLAQQ